MTKIQENRQDYLFDVPINDTTIDELMVPKGYKGLSGFHKYWGKKPLESMLFLIESLTENNDIVLDPFLGSGLIAREAVLRKRRFIGIDINPISTELSSFYLNLPSASDFKSAFESLRSVAKSQIDETYIMEDGRIATHYLWEQSTLTQVWVSQKGKNGRLEFTPSSFDIKQAEYFSSYESKYIQPLNFHQNSRINTNNDMTIRDVFTGRALYNIDILKSCIEKQPKNIRQALWLTLTASSGQMSNMVFAIKNRGKTKGKKSSRIEVGSWVIGYWIPKLHFEINVWNCFNNKATRLSKALNDVHIESEFNIEQSIDEVVYGSGDVVVLNKDASSALRDIPSNSISLVLTDPPHSDRIPYLEMSNLWNSLLGYEPDYENEIVVSDAKDRNKNLNKYLEEIYILFEDSIRVIKDCGYLAIYFNARSKIAWQYIEKLHSTQNSITYLGCFPMEYSAGSVIQDTRKGSLKNDYVLIFRKISFDNDYHSTPDSLQNIPNWSNDLPLVNSK